MSSKKKQASTDFSEKGRKLRLSLAEFEGSLATQMEELELQEKEVSRLAERSEFLKKEMDLRKKKLDARERIVDETIIGVEVREKLLDIREEQVNQRIKKMELREMEWSKEVQVIRKMLEAAQKIVKPREFKEEEVDECQLSESLESGEIREEETGECSVVMDGKCSDEVEGRKKQSNGVLEAKPTDDQSLIRIASEEKEISERCLTVQVQEKEVSRSLGDQDLREERLNEREQQARESKENCEALRLKDLEETALSEFLEAQENDLSELSGAQVSQEKELNGVEMALKEEEISGNCQAVQVKEKQESRSLINQDLREDQLNVQGEQAPESKEICEPLRLKELEEKALKKFLEAQEKELSALFEAHVLTEIELNGRQFAKNIKPTESCNAVDSKEKDLSHTGGLKGKTTTDKKLAVKDDHKTESQLRRLCHLMNGKVLQMFLNERVNKHKSMRVMLRNALQSSNDPAKLVLSALKGFFPPHLPRSNSSYNASDTRSSCALLLEMLMDLKPFISEDVRNEAAVMANQWKKKMKAEQKNCAVVLGFLLLVAAYDLGSKYKTTELQKLCKVIGHHCLEPQLRLRLGLSGTNNVKKSSAYLVTRTEAQNPRAPHTIAQLGPKNWRRCSAEYNAPPLQEVLPRLSADHMLLPRHCTGTRRSSLPARLANREFGATRAGARNRPYCPTCNPPYRCFWCMLTL